MMNISSGRLLLQMNNLTVLYQSGLGVQWYPGPSAFKLNQSLWSSFKTSHNSTGKGLGFGSEIVLSENARFTVQTTDSRGIVTSN